MGCTRTRHPNQEMRQVDTHNLDLMFGVYILADCLLVAEIKDKVIDALWRYYTPRRIQGDVFLVLHDVGVSDDSPLSNFLTENLINSIIFDYVYSTQLQEAKMDVESRLKSLVVPHEQSGQYLAITTSMIWKRNASFKWPKTYGLPI